MTSVLPLPQLLVRHAGRAPVNPLRTHAAVLQRVQRVPARAVVPVAPLHTSHHAACVCLVVKAECRGSGSHCTNGETCGRGVRVAAHLQGLSVRRVEAPHAVVDQKGAQNMERGVSVVHEPQHAPREVVQASSIPDLWVSESVRAQHACQLPVDLGAARPARGVQVREGVWNVARYG
jgi:hypothetical protein